MYKDIASLVLNSAVHVKDKGYVTMLIASVSTCQPVSQKSFNHIHVLPFSQGSRPSYDTTLDEAVGKKQEWVSEVRSHSTIHVLPFSQGCTIMGYDFFL